MKAHTELDTWKRLQAKKQRRRNRVRAFTLHRRMSEHSSRKHGPLANDYVNPVSMQKNMFQAMMALMLNRSKEKMVQKSQRGA